MLIAVYVFKEVCKRLNEEGNAISMKTIKEKRRDIMTKAPIPTEMSMKAK